MLSRLFPGLTRDRSRGAPLMQAVASVARDRHWYVEGEVPDTVDGRFRMLATIAALVVVRLESFGSGGDAVSVALTEQYADLMETEHREMGLGDPALGKKVRLLIGALARRVGVWRSVQSGEPDWASATRDSIYEAEPAASALEWTTKSLEAFWRRLEAFDLSAIEEGRLA